MVCDTKWLEGQNAATRKREIDAALARLEAALKVGTAKIVIGPQGGVAFAGWGETDRKGVSDACAYRVLTASNSWALRQALTRAEAIAGRKADQKQVAVGTHSHDNGKTWHKGH